MFHFYTPQKHEKTSHGLLTFSGDFKMEKLPKPVDTGRRFSVYKTSIQGRRIDVL